jgi:hypothetical protein
VELLRAWQATGISAFEGHLRMKGEPDAAIFRLETRAGIAREERIQLGQRRSGAA